MKKSETGIAHIAAILSVLLVIVTGFAGWRVYESRKADTSNKNQNQPTAGNSSTVTKATLDYENTELGFKLSYPKAWGEPAFKEGAIVSPGQGSYKQLTFASRPDVDINFVQAGFISPLDGCPDPILAETHNLSSMRASVIGWEAENVKRYYKDWESLPATKYIVRLTPATGENSQGWTKLSSKADVLEYQDKNPRPWQAGSAGENNNCQDISQALADEANAYAKFIRYAVNFSSDKVVGVNAQYDSRKSNSAEIRQQLVDVLVSIKK